MATKTLTTVTTARAEYRRIMRSEAPADTRADARRALRRALKAHGQAMIAEGLAGGYAYLDEAEELA